MQVGAVELHLQIVCRHAASEIYGRSEREEHVAVGRYGTSVDRTAVDARLGANAAVGISVEREPLDRSLCIGRKSRLRHHPVERRLGGHAPHRAYAEHRSEIEVGRSHTAAQRACRAAIRVHLHIEVGIAAVGSEASRRAERIETSAEISPQTHPAGTCEHALDIARQPCMRHCRCQRRYVAAVGAYLREGELERCAADVGQPLYCETPLDRSIVGEYGTAYLAGEIAHRTVERHIHVAQSLPPCTYRRCECGNVVGRDGRILQLADHPHVLDEVLVTSPVATLDRHRGHENRGLRRIYRESVETDDTPVDEEIAVHVVGRKAALLGGGQRYYIAPYLVAHHGEVFQAGVSYIDQHIVEVDSRGRVAVHQTLHSEGQIVDVDMIDIHPEITLAVLAREAVDDLLDVHLARRCLAQI